MNVKSDLKEIFTQFKQGLDTLEAKIDKLDGKIEKLEEKFEARFTQIEQKVNQINIDLVKSETEIKGEIKTLGE